MAASVGGDEQLFVGVVERARERGGRDANRRTGGGDQ